MARPALVIRTPAKVNLGLRVLGRRSDGYHRLRTVLAAVDLWDTLSFEPGGEAVRLECDQPGVPADGENLVLRAAAVLEGSLPRGVCIRLWKRIPAGRGLGGGSSDAAAALIGLNRLFGLGLGRFALHRLLARVGMDAPFFLYGGLALAAGRGEQVFPLAAALELPLVLLIPDFGISTADAYRGLPPHPAADRGPDRMGKLLRSVGLGPAGPGFGSGTFADCFPNDLERSAALREIRPPDVTSEMRRALMAAGAVATAMSGSGSAVFGVFPGREDAARAALRLSGGSLRAIATRTISRKEHRAALFGSRSDGAWPRG